MESRRETGLIELVTDQKVEAFLEAFPVTIIEEDLIAMRQAQLLADPQQHKQFCKTITDKLLEPLGGSKVLAKKEGFKDLYMRGELIALGFLIGGDKEKRVITPT